MFDYATCEDRETDQNIDAADSSPSLEGEAGLAQALENSPMGPTNQNSSRTGGRETCVVSLTGV
jgi:hypothetical protein